MLSGVILIRTIKIEDVIIELKQNFLKRYDQQFLDFLKHGSKYTVAKFFVSTISFISISVYTRLLTPSEYGILSVFNSAIGIFAIIYGLQMYGSVSRYYLEKTDDFSDFLGTNLFALFGMIVIEGSILWIFKESIMKFFVLPISLFQLLMATAIVSVGFSIYGNLLVVKRSSTEYALISILQALSVFLFSVFLIYHMKSDKYLGNIYARLSVTLVISSYSFYKLLHIIKFNFKVEYLKYFINYSIPYIPNALSGFILTFFDRIIISQLTNFEKTGLYSFSL